MSTRMTGLNQYQNEVLRTATRDPKAYPECLRSAVQALRILAGQADEHVPHNGAALRAQAEELLKTWDQIIWGLGLAGEAGEVCDLLKKIHGHGKKLDEIDPKKGITPREQLKLELGDVPWYGNALAHSFGYTAEDIATGNSDKLRARHPDGFTVESAEAKADETRAGVPVEPITRFPPDDARADDYCARCGESPDSGTHVVHGHNYVRPERP